MATPKVTAAARTIPAFTHLFREHGLIGEFLIGPAGIFEARPRTTRFPTMLMARAEGGTVTAGLVDSIGYVPLTRARITSPGVWAERLHAMPSEPRAGRHIAKVRCWCTSRYHRVW